MTNAEFAILGLIAEQPRHGYEIEQVIAQRGMRDWTEVGFSSIYFILRKLEQGGYVTSRPAPAEGRGPARKVFTITSAGRRTWIEATRQALSVPQQADQALQLGLANLPALPPQEAAAALEAYRDRLQAQRQQVQARWEAQQPLPFFVDAMFTHSLALMDAELNWIEPVIGKLTEENQNG